MKQFIKELEEKNIDYVIENDRIIITDKNGDVFLDDVSNLPNDITFNNVGDVYLRQVFQLSGNVIFNNSWGVILNALVELGGNVQFNNGMGSLQLRYLPNLPLDLRSLM